MCLPLQQSRKANQTIVHTPSATGINVGGVMPKSERSRAGSMPAGYSAAEAIMQVRRGCLSPAVTRGRAAKTKPIANNSVLLGGD